MSGPRGFTYALQPVLLTRQWEHDAVLQELAQANQQLAAAQAQLDALQARSMQLAEQWRQQSERTADFGIDRWQTTARYLHDLAQQCEAKQQELAACEANKTALADKALLAKKQIDAMTEHRAELQAQFVRAEHSAQFKALDDHWMILQSRRAGHDGQA